jgi:hypothetical protein
MEKNIFQKKDIDVVLFLERMNLNKKNLKNWFDSI